MRLVFTTVTGLGTLMFIAGIFSFGVSFYYNSAAMSFTGLGLTFWGALFIFIHSEEYTKKNIVEATVPVSLAVLEAVLQEFHFKGDPVYLPPSYFEEPETTFIYVSRRKGQGLPPPGSVLKTGSKPFMKTSQGILISPPGIGISWLLEDSLNTRFVKVDLEYVQKRLPQAIVHDLEAAKSAAIEIEGNTTVRLEIVDSAYGNPSENKNESSPLKDAIRCPLCSAVAVALVKCSGKPVRITQVKNSSDGKTINAVFEILEH